MNTEHSQYPFFYSSLVPTTKFIYEIVCGKPNRFPLYFTFLLV